MESTIVIKCGGSTMEQLSSDFFAALSELQTKGKSIVLVHGGGPAINALLNQLNITPQFIDGLRVTCESTMQVVEMVLGGTLNKLLVRKLIKAGAKSWGLSGVDGRLLVAKQTEKPLGLVGEIEQVHVSGIRQLLAQGYLPVVAPLGVSADGEQVLNLNADIAAGAIAAALSAEKLLMVTDVPGILQPGIDGEKTPLTEASAEEIEAMIEAGIIYGGMIPKVRAALDALYQGVQEVVICQGTAADLIAACSGIQVGTSIKGVVKSK